MDEDLTLFSDDSGGEETRQKPAKAVRKNGLSRLMRDLREWIQSKEEFPCIEAVPLDDNIYEWHCNICPDSGDFKNIVFHLIIHFTESYPTKPPEVELCTTIPHPNVFGDWICLDMIKSYEIGQYQGWTPGYSITSILMQLQSFLFEQSNVDQMASESSNNAERIFDPVMFERRYMPRIRSFECDKCGHCYKKPFPVTPSMAKRSISGEKNDGNDNGNNKNKNGNSGGIVGYDKNGYQLQSTPNKSKKKKQKNNKRSRKGKKTGENKNSDFCFWDGIYRDLEGIIFSFFNLKDLMKIKRVAKRFQYLKDSIKCWFHRSLTLPTKELKYKTASKNEYGDDDMSMLCLGFGATPTYFEDDSKSTTLRGQIFGNDLICDQIGHLSMIPSIDTTFDLLSSDAFVNFNIRKTVFNDRQFTHFIPLYLNEKHGKKAMKKMDKFILKIWNEKNGIKKQVIKECHPWLKLYTIANMMKSLIVSVMKESDDNDGSISLHYSVNILESFFRLHHTLMGIYFHHKKEISRLLQHQIKMFFRKQKGDYPYRSKIFIPDFGIFLSYFTLFEDRKSRTWEEIAYQLLDESFTRQSKWILNAHAGLIDTNYCPLRERVLFRWKTSKISNRLFMFNSFFFRECCQLGNQSISLEEQFKLYNDNFGFPSDDGLAFKLQKFVKKLYCDVKDYSQFFEMVGVPYPGMKELGLWFLDCMSNSEYRGYHKRYLYEPKGKMDARRRALQQQKKKEWLRQQQLEREQSRQQYKKQQQMKQRELLQQQQQKTRAEKQKQNKKRKKNNNLAIEASFRYSIPRSRTSSGQSDIQLENLGSRYGYSGSYVRVHVSIYSQSIDQIGSIDAMYFDCIPKIKKATLIKRGKSKQTSEAPRYCAWGCCVINDVAPGPWEIVPELKQVLTDMFNMFAHGKDQTMSSDDFCKYLSRCYSTNENDSKYKSVIKEIGRIIKKYCKVSGDDDALDLEGFLEYYRQTCINNLNDVWRDLEAFNYGYDLKKCEIASKNEEEKEDNRPEFLIKEDEEDKKMSVHYPDATKDGNVKVGVKKETNGRYFADFSISELMSRFDYDFSNARPRIVGKRIGGKRFECRGLTPVQQRRREECSKQQDSQLEEKLQEWKKSRIMKVSKTPSLTKSKYELGVKIPMKAQFITSGFGNEQVPVVVQFSISTLKWTKVSHNVKYIALDCSTVRVLVKIVSGNVKSFDGVYFDGELNEREAKKKEKEKANWATKKKKKVESGISSNGFRFVSFPVSKNGDARVGVRGPIDKDGTVYYCDLPAKSLFNLFGEKLGNGISPRVKGVTFKGNKFCCSGSDEYRIRGKSRQDIAEEEKRAHQLQQQQQQQQKLASKALSRGAPSSHPQQHQQSQKQQAQVQRGTKRAVEQEKQAPQRSQQPRRVQSQQPGQRPLQTQRNQQQVAQRHVTSISQQMAQQENAQQQQQQGQVQQVQAPQMAPQPMQRQQILENQQIQQQRQALEQQAQVPRMQQAPQMEQTAVLTPPRPLQSIQPVGQVAPVQQFQYVSMYSVPQAQMQVQMPMTMQMTSQMPIQIPMQTQIPMQVQVQLPQQTFGTQFQVSPLQQPFGFGMNAPVQQVIIPSTSISAAIRQATPQATPQAIPHGLHNGARPRRPPIAMRSNDARLSSSIRTSSVNTPVTNSSVNSDYTSNVKQNMNENVKRNKNKNINGSIASSSNVRMNGNIGNTSNTSNTSNTGSVKNSSIGNNRKNVNNSYARIATSNVVAQDVTVNRKKAKVVKKRRHHRGKRKNEQVNSQKKRNDLKKQGKRKRKRKAKGQNKGKNGDQKQCNDEDENGNGKKGEVVEEKKFTKKKKKRRRRKKKNGNGSINVEMNENNNIEEKKKKRRRRKKKKGKENVKVESVVEQSGNKKRRRRRKKRKNDSQNTNVEESGPDSRQVRPKRRNGNDRKNNVNNNNNNNKKRGDGKRHHRGRRKKNQK